MLENQTLLIREKESIREVNWDDLVYMLDFVHIKVLHCFYNKDNNVWVLPKLRFHLRNLNVSYSTLIRRLKQLEEFGLIEVIEKSRPMAIKPIIGIEKNINSLIKLSCLKMGFRLE